MKRLPHDLEEQIKALETGKQGIGKDENKVKRPKIQLVPPYLGGMGFEKYFTPQIISFGPFHYGETSVMVGHRYKCMWTAMYLVDTNQQHSYGALFDRINDLKDEVRGSDLYGGGGHHLYFDIFCWERDGRWSWIMDGCSILQVLDKSYDYIHDPEKELKVSIDHLIRVHQDMLLHENQIPFKLLKLICNDNAKFNRCLHNFLNIHGVMIKGTCGEVSNEHHIVVDEAEEEDKDEPIHLLDYLRRAILMKSRDAIAYHPQLQQHANIKPSKRSLHLRKYRIGSIRELKNKGIRVKKHSHDNVFHPIFNSDSATLQLPLLTVDGSTMLIFLNLIAYEMCPDFPNDFEITSYVVFLSSLIETPEDVKELRSCGVLINELANDKEVSDLFNRMDTLLVAETSRYANIRDQMQQHFVSNHSKIKMLGWMGEAYSSFLRSPWTVIALLAATLGLTLTFIQTWFAIRPKGS